MAGFDPVTQRHAKMPGLCIDAGIFDFSDGSATVDVPTNLSRVLGGLAVAEFSAASDPQQTLMAYRVGDASDCKVTFMRAGGMVGEDARMSYIMWGF